ncbi:hypothetical protein QZH41_009597 [Actinostola sp. cb2023]|nr:hypothetical protein QZH41_009597 [Actinostola sp. cb2023]
MKIVVMRTSPFSYGLTESRHRLTLWSVCHHGDWVCKTKKHCQDTLDFCTVFNDPSTGLVTSTCPEGFWCKVQIPSIPEQNIPGVGKCVSKEVTGEYA